MINKTESLTPEVIDIAPLPEQLSDMSLEKLEVMVGEYKALKVTGEGKDRKKSFEVVKRADIDLKKVKSRIEARTTELRRPILAKANEVSAVAKDILKIVSPVVEHLTAERTAEESIIKKIKARKENAEQSRKDLLMCVISEHISEWDAEITSAKTSSDLEVGGNISTFKPDLLFFDDEDYLKLITDANANAVTRADAKWEDLKEKETAAAEQARIAEENRIKAEALAKLEAEMNAKIEAAAADEKRRNDIQATLSGWIDTHLSIMVNGTLGDIKEYCKKLLETVPTADEFGDRVDEAQTKLNSMAADAVLKRNTLEAESEIAEKARIQTEEFAAREKAIADAEAKVKADAEAKEAADRKAEADRVEHEWIVTACEEADEKAKLKYAEGWIEAHIHNTEFDIAKAKAAKELAEAEEKEIARIESLRPDKERILVFLRDVYGGIEFPVVSNPEADAILDKFSGDITALIHWAREKANAL